MSLDSYLRAAPKAELHVHLEGSVRPRTVLTLAERNGVELPHEDLQGLRQWFRFKDFDHFIEVYMTITRCLQTLADYELIIDELAAEMASQGVRYAEVTFSPSTHWQLGVPQDVWFEGLSRGRRAAAQQHDVEINWVFDIVRNNTGASRASCADYCLQAAIDGKEEGVVALGLGGDEARFPAEEFARWFDKARQAGLHSAPHAGEHAGPESVWAVLGVLGAERIGHGIRAIEDPALCAYLAERDIALELCPTSNIRLGVYPDYDQHPLDRLHEAGVPVTVNSDDPALFDTTLRDEVTLLDYSYGLDVDAIDEVLLNGLRYAFLPPERKAALEADYRAELTRLKDAHL